MQLPGGGSAPSRNSEVLPWQSVGTNSSESRVDGRRKRVDAELEGFDSGNLECGPLMEVPHVNVVRIHTLAGMETSFAADRFSRGMDVKFHIATVLGIKQHQQRILHGTDVVQNEDLLSDLWDGVGAELEFSVIRICNDKCSWCRGATSKHPNGDGQVGMHGYYCSASCAYDMEREIGAPDNVFAVFDISTMRD